VTPVGGKVHFIHKALAERGTDALGRSVDLIRAASDLARSGGTVTLTISQKTRLSLDRCEASNLLSDAVEKNVVWKQRRRPFSSASRSKPVFVVRAVIYQRTARGSNTMTTSSTNVCGKMRIRQNSKQLPEEAQIVHSNIS
jgi:hypothetical protein